MKLCDRKIKLSAVTIFYLNIIFCYLIHNLSLCSAINTQSIIFMHHIITRL